MKKQTVKKVLALALTAAMGMSLAACGGSSEPAASSAPAAEAAASSAPAAEEAAPAAEEAAPAAEEAAPAAESTELRVTVQAWMMGKYDFEGAKASFEANHPGVTVTYNQVDNVDVTSSMLEWSQGKTSCDIAIGGDRSQTVPYIANGYVIDFTEENFFNGDFARDNFYEAFLENGNVDGHQFMIPLVGEVVGIVYNKAMFKEAGLLDENGEAKAPETWDDVYEYAKALTKDGQTGIGIDWGANMMLYTYEACSNGLDGNIYGDDGTTLDFDDDNIKEMLSVWRKLIEDGYTTTDVFNDMDANRTQFKSGTLAMHIAPASRWIEASAADVLGEENVGLMPVPGTAENGSLVYIHGIVVPTVSPNQELAIQFIKEELLKDSFQQGAINTYGKMSPMKAHYENLENPYWDVCLSFVENAITAPLYKDGPKIDMQIQTEMQNFLSGSSSVDDFANNMTQYISTMDLSNGMG